MTPKQIEIVQSNYEAVEPIADKAAELFYGKLFEIAPEVKPLFKGDIADQGQKLMTMIGLAVRGLNDLEKIVPAVQNLGKTHVAYGVKEEHFAPVGESLLWTLEQGLGDAWNSEAKEAWTTVYGVLSSTMIDAMNEVEEPAPTTGFFGKLKSAFA